MLRVVGAGDSYTIRTAAGAYTVSIRSAIGHRGTTMKEFEIDKIIREAANIRLRVKVDRLIESAAPIVGSIDMTVERWMQHGDEYMMGDHSTNICDHTCECRQNRWRVYPEPIGLLTRSREVEVQYSYRTKRGKWKAGKRKVIEWDELSSSSEMGYFDLEYFPVEYSYEAIEREWEQRVRNA